MEVLYKNNKQKIIKKTNKPKPKQTTTTKQHVLTAKRSIPYDCTHKYIKSNLGSKYYVDVMQRMLVQILNIRADLWLLSEYLYKCAMTSKSL